MRLLRRHWRQFFHLQNVHAEVADLAQTQSGEFRHRLAHLAKNIFDREIPIRHRRLPGSNRARFPNRRARVPAARTARFSRCNRPLPLIIEPRFSAKAARGQNDRSLFRSPRSTKYSSRSTQGVAPSCSTGMPNLHRIFSENRRSALIWPDFTASDNLEQFCARAQSSTPRISRAPFVFGLRSSLSRMSSPGRGAGRCRSSSRPNDLRELRRQPKLLVGHSAGSDDGDFRTGELL